MKRFFPKSELSINIENFEELKHFTMPKLTSGICDVRVYERNAKLAIRYTYLKVIISYSKKKFSHYTLQEHTFLTLEQKHGRINGTYITQSIEAIINDESILPQFQLGWYQPKDTRKFGTCDGEMWHTTYETYKMTKIAKLNQEKTVQENRAILKNQLIEEIEKRRTVNNPVLIEIQTSNLTGSAKSICYDPAKPEEFLNNL